MVAFKKHGRILIMCCFAAAFITILYLTLYTESVHYQRFTYKTDHHLTNQQMHEYQLQPKHVQEEQNFSEHHTTENGNITEGHFVPDELLVPSEKSLEQLIDMMEVTTMQRDEMTESSTEPASMEKEKLQEERLWAEPLVAEPDDEAYKHLLSQEIRNVPFDYWIDNEKNRMQLNGSCAKYPNLYDLDIHNIYWQTVHVANATLQLYGAYYDNRTNELERPVLRIIAMANQLGYKFANSYCQQWFENETRPHIMPVIKYQNMWPTYWGRHEYAYYPHLLTCKVRHPTNKVPKAVSLVASECDTARNNLRVHFEPALKKERFAVCVKGLDFPYNDISVRLIEWLEVMRILGASKVFMYHFDVHPRVAKVLWHYQKQGFVDIKPLTLVNGVPNKPHYQHLVLQKMQFNKRQNEIVPYNDCLYRNMYKYDYVSAVDIDEVIMPRGNLTTWEQLIHQAEIFARENQKKCPNGYVSICFRNAYVAHHLESDHIGIPNYLYMLQHTQRLQEHSKIGRATKCFHNTTEALTLHNHYALFQLKSCRPTTLDPNVGHLLHYHKLQSQQLNEPTVEETDLLRFSEIIVKKSRETMLSLGFLTTAANTNPS